jgi:hypothetical protein
MVQKCVHIYANGKMRPVETVPGMGEGGIKEDDGDGEFNYDILEKKKKNFCKCHNIPPVQQCNKKRIKLL